MKKIAVLNNKGGVGKSTVAVQISHGLSMLGFKVILVDLDGQNDSSLFLGISEKDYNKTFFDLIDKRNDVKLEDCIINARESLDLLPNSHIEEINAEFYRESRIDLILNEKLQGLENLGYDFVVVDCGPQRTRINDSVLCYVDNIVMPVQVEAAAVRACGSIYEYLSDLRLSPDKISLIIPNMYDQRTRDAKENLEFLREFFKDEDNIVTNPINRRVKITEAGKMGKTVFEYDEESAQQFFEVLERLVKKVG
ncbi:ParA family protein [Clostridium frigidicarnis]|uniref:Chromosome partitioning protein n=1 Tax=Clostridium frigidicarnis TaxID=84698 RepID=A0A1I1B8L7_9CLOT|nr:ParA family protein [Clostridium frigidicarnis]SFB46006.1 chromosome partitioning protein [Clostridium frigidicarnis]